MQGHTATRRSAELNCHRPESTGEQCGAERLHEQVATHPRQPATQACAQARTERNQYQGVPVNGTEDDAKRRRPGAGKHSESRNRDRGISSDRLQRGSRRDDVDAPIAYIIDHFHGGDDLVHVDTGRGRANDFNWAIHGLIEADTDLVPARNEARAMTQRHAKPCHGGNRALSGLPVLEQKLGA
jgi:hypothetical protein